MSQTKIQMGPLQIAIILLTVATAIVHLTLVFPSPLFILNGLGYLVLPMNAAFRFINFV